MAVVWCLLTVQIPSRVTVQASWLKLLDFLFQSILVFPKVPQMIKYPKSTHKHPSKIKWNWDWLPSVLHRPFPYLFIFSGHPWNKIEGHPSLNVSLSQPDSLVDCIDASHFQSYFESTHLTVGQSEFKQGSYILPHFVPFWHLDCSTLVYQMINSPQTC